MSKNFKLWDNYAELLMAYNQENAMSDLFSDVPSDPTKPGPVSEHAIFNYAVDKIGALITEEIATLEMTCRSKATEQLQKDIETLTQIFRGKVATQMAQATDENALHTIGKNFLVDAQAMLKKYEPQIESDKSWGPFLKNLGMLLSIIGTLPALFSIGTKLGTGRYSFFDKKSIGTDTLDAPLANFRAAPTS